MVLIFAVIIGLVAGYLKAKGKGLTYQPVDFKHVWLLLLATLPQYFTFFLPVTRQKIPDQWIPYILISTQLLLLVFIWLNRRLTFVWLLGLGLMLNFLVIVSNRGWMPITPEMLELHGVPASSWQIGARHNYSKDMVLIREQTNLWFLSDILTLPNWMPYRVAFSIGDVIIAVGTISVLLQNYSQNLVTLKSKKMNIKDKKNHDKECIY